MITLVLTLATGDRATLSVAGLDMQRDLGISSIEMGYLFSVFSWAYVICMTPAGWVSDKFGSKLAMFLGVLIWSIVTIGMGFVSYISLIIPALLILRFLLGVCEAPVGPSAGRIIAAWFPSAERGVAGAIFNSAQYVSIAVFMPLMGWLCHTFGWQHVFIIMGLLGMLVAFLWNKIFHVPMKHPWVNQAELEHIRQGGGLIDLDMALGQDTQGRPVKKSASWYDIGQLFKSRMLIGIFIAQYCINAITWFFMSWFPIYLVKERGLTILQAGMIASVPAICGLAGGITSGYISDWLLKKTNNLSLARKGPITFGLTLSATMMLCNYVQTESMVIFFMSLAFFGKGFGSLGWAVVADTAPKKIIGITGGIFNSIGNLSGIITPVVIGYVLSMTGSFQLALIFVGSHGIIAVLSYWVIVGKIKRLELTSLALSPTAPVPTTKKLT
ncbi:MFS transporter [Martelella alba]|uniref:MFS transporter n=2 Tax=Martelella alba TaxID=2590451 RepID=A0ABY2SG23_9HYPH|nr:MFS transporter [Martelella alba]